MRLRRRRDHEEADQDQAKILKVNLCKFVVEFHARFIFLSLSYLQFNEGCQPPAKFWNILESWIILERATFFLQILENWGLLQLTQR